MVSNIKEKYVVVTPFFPSPNQWQGAYVLDQVKAIMRHSDYDVIVYKTISLRDKEFDYEIDSVKVHCIRPLLMPSYILNGLTGKIVAKQFVKKLRKDGLDLKDIAYIHCHTTNHAAFGFGVRQNNPNAKVILQFHDPDPFTLRNGKFADKSWNLRFRAQKSINTINRVDLLLCISEHVKDAVLSFPNPRKNEVFEPIKEILGRLNSFPYVKPKATYVLNNGVDLKMFKKLNVSKKSTDYRIGCIANFNDWKNHIMLVKAFKILVEKGYDDMRLSLLGSGETRLQIEEFVHDNGLDEYVEWPKEVYHDYLPTYYNSLDLFVLPSRFEGFGCVYTEAYACGVPFICTEHQGASECVSDDEKSLWLVRDNDYKHLASLIERQYIEKNHQHLCKEFDIDILIPKFLEFLKEKFNG